MSALFQRGLLQTENILVQCKRYGSKINIQRPRPPHYTRKLFNAVTEPVYPRRTAIDFCQEQQALKQLEKDNKEKNILHPYESILAKELFDCFDSSKMILICHTNSMDGFEFFNFKVAMHKKNIQTKVFSRKIIKGAIEDTKFNAMLPLLTNSTHSCMLFSDEWNVNDVLTALKKLPKVILLAGTLGDRYMSRNELENYAKLPDLSTVRAQFVATMNSVGGQLTNHLQAHQSNLAYMLDAHAEALKSSNTTSDGGKTTTNATTTAANDDKSNETTDKPTT